MTPHFKRRLDAHVEGRLRDLRRRTERVPLDIAFADRVMLAVNGAPVEPLWLGTETALRSFLVCGVLVAFALGWAQQTQGPSGPELFATTAVPMEGAW